MGDKQLEIHVDYQYAVRLLKDFMKHKSTVPGKAPIACVPDQEVKQYIHNPHNAKMYHELLVLEEAYKDLKQKYLTLNVKIQSARLEVYKLMNKNKEKKSAISEVYGYDESDDASNSTESLHQSNVNSRVLDFKSEVAEWKDLIKLMSNSTDAFANKLEALKKKHSPLHEKDEFMEHKK